MKMRFDPSFYCITDQASALGRTDEAVSSRLLKGGATVLQYRAKKVPAREQFRTALKLRALTRAAGVPLIVNDRVDLALACGADGVHLGQDDLPVSLARRLAGNKLKLGVSTHSLAQALEAEREGADYIGFGPVFPTQTKENNVPPVGLRSLAQVCRRVRIPVVAIGGIKAAMLPALASQGARCIAVVTALTGARDVEAAARSYRERWFELRTPAAGGRA
jgi:thiamine-phosphate pyrophosphorylase